MSGKWSHVSAAYVALCERRAGLLLLALAILSALCLLPISRLELRTDLTELLPDDHPGVVALRQVAARQRSSTNLVLLIESPDRASNWRLAEALRPVLLAMVPGIFSEVQWRPETEVAAYAQRYLWLYASREDLQSAEALLGRLIARRKSPLLVDLEGDPEAELSALRRRMRPSLPAQAEAPYFEGEKGGRHHLGIMLWRKSDGLATLGDRQTLDAVKAQVARLRPTAFHPQMKVAYSGPIAMSLDEQDAVRQDLTLATTLCVSGVLLVIWAYFRRVAFLLVVGAPAVLGVLLALSLGRFTIGNLNANTAFLISIILGNGINTPIILLSRYGEERRRGVPVADALPLAMAATMRATLIAAAAASIAYGCLLLSSLRGLSQFGLIGGAGMLFAFLATFVLVPPLVLFGERLLPGRLTPVKSAFRGPFRLLGRLAERAPRLLLLLVLALVALSLFPAVRYLRDPLEYHFANLRMTNKDADRSWALMYDLGMGNVGAGHIARDGVILVDAPEQADVVARALWQKELARGERRILESVRTLSGLLPEDQEEKLAIISRIRAQIDRHQALVSEDEQRELLAWRPPAHLRRLTLADLPRRLRENFTEVDGTMGRLIGIDADPRRWDESDGRELVRLSRSMEVTVLGKTWVAASTSTVFAGMLEIIVRDGPRVTAAAFIGVFLLIFVAFGCAALPVLLTVLVGMSWLLGAVGMLGQKLNFLNFVAIPLTLGIGADYAANLWARLRREGGGLGTVIEDTGAAVALCSLTTVIGYSSLLLCRSGALQSFGVIAVLGEATCLLAALLVLPAIGRAWR